MESNEGYMLSAARSYPVYDNIGPRQSTRSAGKIRAVTLARNRPKRPTTVYGKGNLSALIYKINGQWIRPRTLHRRPTSPPEDPLLTALDRETHLRVVQPRMISGHLQGRLLEMLVQMISPQRILEIGTFTGYSAICMARGLQAGGEIHTIEIDDELEEIAAKYFREAEQNIQGRIIHTAARPRSGAGVRYIRPDLYRRRQAGVSAILRNGDALARPQRQLPVGRQHSLVRQKWRNRLLRATVSPTGIKQFNRMVTEDDRVENVILPIRDGLNLIRVK